MIINIEVKMTIHYISSIEGTPTTNYNSCAITKPTFHSPALSQQCKASQADKTSLYDDLTSPNNSVALAANNDIYKLLDGNAAASHIDALIKTIIEYSERRHVQDAKPCENFSDARNVGLRSASVSAAPSTRESIGLEIERTTFSLNSHKEILKNRTIRLEQLKTNGAGQKASIILLGNSIESLKNKISTLEATLENLGYHTLPYSDVV